LAQACARAHAWGLTGASCSDEMPFRDESRELRRISGLLELSGSGGAHHDDKDCCADVCEDWLDHCEDCLDRWGKECFGCLPRHRAKKSQRGLQLPDLDPEACPTCAIAGGQVKQLQSQVQELQRQLELSESTVLQLRSALCEAHKRAQREASDLRLKVEVAELQAHVMQQPPGPGGGGAAALQAECAASRRCAEGLELQAEMSHVAAAELLAERERAQEEVSQAEELARRALRRADHAEHVSEKLRKLLRKAAASARHRGGGGGGCGGAAESTPEGCQPSWSTSSTTTRASQVALPAAPLEKQGALHWAVESHYWMDISLGGPDAGDVAHQGVSCISREGQDARAAVAAVAAPPPPLTTARTW